MNKFHYFKFTFLLVTAGTFVGTIVYGLFDIDYSKSEEYLKLLLKAATTAVGTGFVTGILNMFFKIGSFQKK
jgi:hypothetical protein